MSRRERVVENLNNALRRLLDDDPRVYLIGEDIVDPYGGAFKATKGLSTRHPDRVLGSPISEGGITGVGGGLALMGNRPIVEMMFADFSALAFDQLLNFASKSVSMYGRRVPMSMVARCPSGGNRGYGPTHSQSLQKHFLGIPELSVYEMSPFHDNHAVFTAMLDEGRPCVFFEDKVLYAGSMFTDGVVSDLMRYDLLEDGNTVRVRSVDDETPDWIVIAPGGTANRVMAAMRSLLMEEEVNCHLLVPSRLYPFDIGPLLPRLRSAGRICVLEDGTAGGTWGEVLSQQIHTRLWGKLSDPVLLLSAQASVIPTASHLEREILLQEATIHRALAEGAAK